MSRRRAGSPAGTVRLVVCVVWPLAYDYDGQLSTITQGATTTSFAYDAAERRTSRTAGGVTTKFVFAGSQVLLEKQGTSTTRTYGNARWFA